MAAGWLDEHHPELDVPDQAEEHFLEWARLAGGRRMRAKSGRCCDQFALPLRRNLRLPHPPKSEF